MQRLGARHTPVKHTAHAAALHITEQWKLKFLVEINNRKIWHFNVIKFSNTVLSYGYFQNLLVLQVPVYTLGTIMLRHSTNHAIKKTYTVCMVNHFILTLTIHYRSTFKSTHSILISTTQTYNLQIHNTQFKQCMQ